MVREERALVEQGAEWTEEDGTSREGQTEEGWST